jgi:hypothetical protein
MADDRSTIILPDNSHPGYYPAYGGGFGNGFGSFNSIADLFGLAIIASMFGWNGGNWAGGNFGGGAGAAGFLSNQLNNDSGRELIMNAVTSQGEASRTAISNLANTLGQDFNLVNAGVMNVQNALNALALQQAVSVPQIMNSIASGDASIISAFQKCCCEQKLLTVEQGYQSQIRTIEQTNALSGQADRNTAAITAAIAAQTTMINDKFCDLEKREMQATIARQADTIGQLRSAADNAAQTSQIMGYVNSVLTPIATKVNEIAAKQLPTVNVQWPQLQAINTTPYVSGGIYGAYGYGYGNGNGLVF